MGGFVFELCRIVTDLIVRSEPPPFSVRPYLSVCLCVYCFPCVFCALFICLSLFSVVFPPL